LMGEGHQIRRVDADGEQALSLNRMVKPQLKQYLGEEEEVFIREHSRLRIALDNEDMFFT